MLPMSRELLGKVHRDRGLNRVSRRRKRGGCHSPKEAREHKLIEIFHNSHSVARDLEPRMHLFENKEDPCCERVIFRQESDVLPTPRRPRRAESRGVEEPASLGTAGLTRIFRHAFRLLGAAKDNGLLKRGPQVEAPLSDPQTKQKKPVPEKRD